MSDPTDLQSEIERKAIETLAEWTERVGMGLCTRDAAHAALRALWGAVAGLVSRETMSDISDAIEMVARLSEDTSRYRLLQRGDKVLLVEKPHEFSEQVQVITLSLESPLGALVRIYGHPDETPREMLNKYRTLVGDAVSELGFVEI